MKNIVNTEADKTLQVINKCDDLIEKNIKALSIRDEKYDYETIPATLVEQRDICRVEMIRLEKIQQDEVKIVDCMNKLKAILPLVLNKNYKRVRYLNQLDLPGALQQLNNELNNFHTEYLTSLNYTRNKFLSAHKGIKGEKNLEEELNLYKDRIKALYNIRLETEGTTVESDTIVISSNGVFSIEVKNYGDIKDKGKIIVSEDGLWKRYSCDGKEIGIEDVTAQVYRHIGISQRFVNEQIKRSNDNDPYIEFNPIIVIANDTIEVDNRSRIPILRVSNVFHYINNFKSKEKIHQDTCNKIEMVLKDNNRSQKPYPIEKRADKILSIYSILAKKVEVFNNIDKVLKIEKNLLPVAFIGNERFIELLKKFDFGKNSADKVISNSELSCLISYIEQLHQKTWIDREIYEGIIKYYFKVRDLKELGCAAAEHINNCIRIELQASK